MATNQVLDRDLHLTILKTNLENGHYFLDIKLYGCKQKQLRFYYCYWKFKADYLHHHASFTHDYHDTSGLFLTCIFLLIIVFLTFFLLQTHILTWFWLMGLASFAMTFRWGQSSWLIYWVEGWSLIHHHHGGLFD